MTYYKILDPDGRPRYGVGTWELPNGKPGSWMPKLTGDLVPCSHGYHLCREQDLLAWLGPEIYEAEPHPRYKIVESHDKVVVRQARLLRRVDTWNERTARLFAVDCAERVLLIYERVCPGDDRPRKAIEAARRFANGEIDAAARAAAGAAAGAAAWAAAWDAARAAARAAARDAERSWQTSRLRDYIEGRIS